MAYRTYVGTTGKDSIQILGNNEFYKPFIDELKRQGVDVNKDGCYGWDYNEEDEFEIEYTRTPIKEIQPFIDILEQYIWEKDKEIKIYNEDIFNLRPNEKTIIKDFTFRMRDLKENGYIFVTANLVDYLKENLEMHYDIEKKKYVYKIKEGKYVWFEAY